MPLEEAELQNAMGSLKSHSTVQTPHQHLGNNKEKTPFYPGLSPPIFMLPIAELPFVLDCMLKDHLDESCEKLYFTTFCLLDVYYSSCPSISDQFSGPTFSAAIIIINNCVKLHAANL